MNLSVERNELKYFISEAQSILLAKKIKHVLAQDRHLQKKGYFVRSLYFDSPDNECLFEKDYGEIFRKKYRLRIYDSAAKEAKFEIKHKLNSQIFKETAIVTKSSAEKIIAGDYEEFLRYKNSVLNKAYITFTTKNYQPKVVIDYNREAYKWSLFNIRITIDRNLRFNCADHDIFSNHLVSNSVITTEKRQILEIKFDRILPDYIKDLLQIESLQRSAISKYSLGRVF